MANILLVEDDKNMAALFLEFMADADHIIFHAEDGTKAQQ